MNVVDEFAKCDWPVRPLTPVIPPKYEQSSTWLVDPGEALRVCLDGFEEAQMAEVEGGLREALADLKLRMGNVSASDWELELQRFLYEGSDATRTDVMEARRRMWAHQAVAIVAGATARLAGQPPSCPAIPHVPVVPRQVPSDVLDAWRREVRDHVVSRPHVLEDTTPEKAIVAACAGLDAWPDRQLAQVMARAYALYVLWWSKAWQFLDLALQDPAAA